MLTSVISFFHGRQLNGAKIDFVEAFFQEIERRVRDGEEKEASIGQLAGQWPDFTVYT
jgi:hypothetical protein